MLLASSTTWWLVTTSPSGRTRTPEPSALSTRLRSPSKEKSSPKKRRKNGSLKNGEVGALRTTRLV